MKILAVDYGASRTGLAVCDPTEFLTTPITPQITLKARPKVAAEVCRIAQEQKAELIVVGLPLNDFIYKILKSSQLIYLFLLTFFCFSIILVNYFIN